MQENGHAATFATKDEDNMTAHGRPPEKGGMDKKWAEVATVPVSIAPVPTAPVGLPPEKG